MNAIEKAEGPCLIMAGAGTGKTQTIIEKIKYLVNNKIYSPERIVCITFSNEAANNLLSRVRRELDSETEREPIIKTFHAFSAYLLREYGEKIGVDKEFKILDPDAGKIMLHSSFKINPSYCHKYISSIGSAKDLGIEIKEYEALLVKLLNGRSEEQIAREFEIAQFELQTLHLKSKENPDKYSTNSQNSLMDNSEKRILINRIIHKKDDKSILVDRILGFKRIVELSKFLKMWKGYEKLKEKKNSLDYSDLNLLAIKLLRNSRIFENFDYIIVDEFQDTNKVQIELLNEIAKKGNLTVVGDLNQSIYGFRGAYKGNLDIFKENFGVGKEDIYNLDLSYRSPNAVLRNAHLLISNNYRNKDDCFFVENAHGREGEKIKIYEMVDGKEEMRKVVEIIEEEISKGLKEEEICVMFRTHQQSRMLKKMFEERGIEYISVGKNSLLKQNSIKLVVNYLILLNGMKNEKSNPEAWWNLFYDSGLEGEDLEKMGKLLKNPEKGENINELLMNDDSRFDFSEEGRYLLRIIRERMKNLKEFKYSNLEELLEEIYRVMGVIDSENENNKEIWRFRIIEPHFAPKSPIDNLEKLATQSTKLSIIMNLNKFRDFVKAHSGLYEGSLESFIYYLDIMDKLDIEIDSAELEEKGVRIMTSHSTKGLEFKIVILTNMAEKRFPLLRISENILVPSELFPEFESGIEDIEAYKLGNLIAEERRLCYVSFTRAKEKLIMTYAKEYAEKKFLPSRFLNEIDFKNNKDIEFIQDFDSKYSSTEKELKIVSAENLVKKEKNIDKAFSPSALLTFLECQKMFEYKYIFNMPEKKTFSWEAIQLGSFVHLVLENGVKGGFRNVKDFIDLAKDYSSEEEWKDIALDESIFLIKVFFERNKNKYNEKSLTEQCLKMKKEGFSFVGFADRIDFLKDGIEIVDYKTGKSPIYGKDRDWQLGYYALAASGFGKVRKVTLDMLKHEKPIEFQIDENGNALEIINKRVSFNIYEVEKELLETAREISKAYSKGFKACPIEKNCEFCNEYVYRL